MGKISKNLSGKTGKKRSVRYNTDEFESALSEILYDDKITEDEADYIREVFFELQYRAEDELDGLLAAYGIYKTQEPVISKSSAGRRNKVFLMIVIPPVLLAIVRILFLR